MRQYGEDLLRGIPDEETGARSRHAQYYADFLERRRRSIRTRQSKAVQAEIELEWGNVCAAWQTMLAGRLARLVRRSADTLLEFFELRARPGDGAPFFEQAAQALDIPQPDAITEIARGVVLFYQGYLLGAYAQMEQGLVIGRQSLALLRKHGCTDEMSMQLASDAMGYLVIGERDRAKQCADEAAAQAESASDLWFKAPALVMTGCSLSCQKDNAGARRLGEAGLKAAEAAQDLHWAGAAYSQVLAASAFNLGELELAKAYCRRSIENFEVLGAPWWTGFAMNVSIEVFLAAGDYAEALRLCQRTLRSLGDGKKSYWTAGTLLHAARVFAAQGQHERAVELLALVLTDPVAEKWDIAPAEGALADLRAWMSDADFEAACDRGKALDFDTAVSRLLADVIA